MISRHSWLGSTSGKKARRVRMWERVAGRVTELEVGGGVGRVKEWDEWGEESRCNTGKERCGREQV